MWLLVRKLLVLRVAFSSLEDQIGFLTGFRGSLVKAGTSGALATILKPYFIHFLIRENAVPKLQTFGFS